MFFLYFTNFYISFNRDSCILLHFETLFFFFLRLSLRITACSISRYPSDEDLVDRFFTSWQLITRLFRECQAFNCKLALS